MKKIISLILSLSIFISVVSPIGVVAFADDESPFTYEIIGGSAYITGYTPAINEIEDVVIPSTIDGCPVIEITNEAFRGCDTIVSVSIPDSVIRIYGYAFSDCTSITQLDIPDSVIYIGDGAFSGMTSLVSITIPESVSDYGYEILEGCSSLESVTLPFIRNNNHLGSLFGKNEFEGSYEIYYRGSDKISYYYVPNTLKNVVISSGDYFNFPTFYGCSSLTSITLPDSLSYMPNDFIFGCTNLKSINIPDSAQYINISILKSLSTVDNIYVSDNCLNYSYSDGVLFDKDKTDLLVYNQNKEDKTYAVPDSVREICSYAFQSNSNIENIVMSANVSEIGEYAFYECSNLKKIKLSSNLSDIGACAFQYCASLEKISIPVNVSQIKYHTFFGCSSLKEITISAVNSIGNNAFSLCTALEDVYYAGDEASWNNVSIGAYNECLTDANIHYNHYTFSYIVLEDGTACVTSLPKGAENVVIPSEIDGYTVTALDDYFGIFNYDIKSVYLPETLTTFGELCFLESTLENIYVDENNSCFSSVNGVVYNKDKTAVVLYPMSKPDTSYVIPDTVTQIDDYAIVCVMNLEEIIIPQGVTSIGNSAFTECVSLESIVIPNTVTDIGEYAFSYCYSLKNIYLTAHRKSGIILSSVKAMILKM